MPNQKIKAATASVNKAYMFSRSLKHLIDNLDADHLMSAHQISALLAPIIETLEGADDQMELLARGVARS